MNFETMIEKTKTALEERSEKECLAIALFTDKGNFYIAYCNTFSNCCEKTGADYSIINDLIESEETRFLKMIALFKQGKVIDISPAPCFEFCQLIYDMNNDNIDVEVGGDGKSSPYLKELFCK